MSSSVNIKTINLSLYDQVMQMNTLFMPHCKLEKNSQSGRTERRLKRSERDDGGESASIT